MLRSVLTAAAFAALATPAFATSFVFQTEQPVEDARIVTAGTVWVCEGTTCRGDMDRKKVAVSVCKKFAKKVGKVTAFKNDKSELTAEQIEACNKKARS